MPLYEYICDRCAHEFEDLVSGSTTPPCPRCQAPGPRRVLSVVALGTSRERQMTPAACGTCGDPRGPGACSRS